MKNFHSSTSIRGGFTLLEVCLAMGLMGLLAAGIFALAAGSVELSAEMIEYQDDEAVRRRLIELCRANIESLPGHSSIELNTVESGSAYTTYLSLVEHPAAFAFAGSRFDVHRVVVATGVQSSGFLEMRLHYLDAEADFAWRQGNFSQALDRGHDVLLLGRLRQAAWRFYEVRQRRWVENWKPGQGRPAMAELTLELEGDPGPERLIFFVPASEGAGAAGTGFSNQQLQPGQAGDETSTDEAGNPPPESISSPQLLPQR